MGQLGHGSGLWILLSVGAAVEWETIDVLKYSLLKHIRHSQTPPETHSFRGHLDSNFGSAIDSASHKTLRPYKVYQKTEDITEEKKLTLCVRFCHFLFEISNPSLPVKENHTHPSLSLTLRLGEGTCLVSYGLSFPGGSGYSSYRKVPLGEADYYCLSFCSFFLRRSRLLASSTAHSWLQ